MPGSEDAASSQESKVEISTQSELSEPVCTVCGHGHSAELDRLEHWLLESGGLLRATDLGERGGGGPRPRGGGPGKPPPLSTVSRAARRGRTKFFYPFLPLPR